MPPARRPSDSASRPNCGCRREPGKRRTSAILSTPAPRSSATNSSSGCVEWPTVSSSLAGTPSWCPAARMLRMARDFADRGRGTTPTVTVRGDAIVRADPDEALVWITLSALQDAPGPALADVSDRSDALIVLLDELGVARPDR